MIDATFDVSICLKVETERDIDLITDILNVKPTDSIKKGERRSKVLDAAECNVWIYDEEHTGCKSTEEMLYNFLKKIPQLHQNIEDLKRIGIVTIRVSVVSDFAQIGFGLSEDDLSILSELQIPLEISVFSWGQCIDI